MLRTGSPNWGLEERLGHTPGVPLARALVALSILVTFGQLLRFGMFGDGLQYALIALNLSEGIGSFWDPQDVGPFRDQPPLGLWLQSLWFRALGDGLWVERLHSLVVTHALVLATPLVLHRAGVRVPPWPFLLLMWANPHLHWVAQNNVLEPTMALFALGAVGCSIGACKQDRPGLSALAGLLVLAAVLTKGPAGLFPLAVPVFLRRPKQLAVMLGALLFPAAALLLYGPARAFALDYAQAQLLPALAGTRDPAPHRFFLATAFLQDFGPPLGVGVLAWLAAGRPALTSARLPALIALAAALPLLVSPKQARWYLVPAIPYATAALTMVLRDTWRRLEPRIPDLGRAPAILLIATPLLAVLFAGHPHDRPVQEDVYLLDSSHPIHAAEPELMDHRGLRFALARMHRTELRPPAPAPGIHLSAARTGRPGCTQVSLKAFDLHLCP